MQFREPITELDIIKAAMWATLGKREFNKLNKLLQSMVDKMTDQICIPSGKENLVLCAPENSDIFKLRLVHDTKSACSYGTINTRVSVVILCANEFNALKSLIKDLQEENAHMRSYTGCL